MPEQFLDREQFATAIKQDASAEKENPESREGTHEAVNILARIIEEKNRAKVPGGDTAMVKHERLIGEISAYEKTIQRILERLGYGDVAFRKVGSNLFEIPIKKAKDYPDIGKQYGFKGGQARAILLRELGIDPRASVRDVDIARLYDEDTDGTDEVTAQQYAPEDYQNGHGVERLERDYFESRDFTMNEVLATDNKLYLTKECPLDSIRRIVRFSKHERQELREHRQDKWKGGFFINDKLMAKAVRFTAAEAARGERMEIADKEAYKHLEINDFHLALHLDRALEQGWNVAMEYIRQMQKHGQIPEDVDDPADFLKNFIREMGQSGAFIFRHAPSNMYDNEERFLQELNEFIARHQSSRPRSEILLESEERYGDIAAEFEQSLARK